MDCFCRHCCACHFLATYLNLVNVPRLGWRSFCILVLQFLVFFLLWSLVLFPIRLCIMCCMKTCFVHVWWTLFWCRYISCNLFSLACLVYWASYVWRDNPAIMILTLWGWDKMPAIPHMTFSNAFFNENLWISIGPFPYPEIKALSPTECNTSGRRRNM